ncbi:Thioredoxin H9 [Abeliophyllum distichum]|uniref:Thioredoxin H9 n=1 Tax=Abeliophyllum distichum TaxID=126358 RepID=A0ABD1NSN0_9LAMI
MSTAIDEQNNEHNKHMDNVSEIMPEVHFKEIAPAYSELADKYPSILFLTVDVDKLAELSTKWDIKATPSFFFLRDGRQLDTLVGSNKAELQKKMTAIAESN